MLWSERNDRHEGKPLAELDHKSAILAAGAVLAAFILTGAEAITVKPSAILQKGSLPIVELQTLPGGENARAILGSRLFSPIPDSENQFKPFHRSVAEFLGAQWLAKVVTDEQTCDRVLAMLTIDSGVPASLRGIHAWLAQDERFAQSVIDTDPYGLLRYGDADGLTVAEGRQLLHSLVALEQANPYFRAEDWQAYSAKGLTFPELLDDIRIVLLSNATTYQLRTLLLAIVRGTALATELASELNEIMLNIETFSFSERYAAALVILSLNKESPNWWSVFERLGSLGDDNSTRLVLEIMEDAKFYGISSDMIATAVLKHVGLHREIKKFSNKHHGAGTLFMTAAAIPDVKIAGVLNAISAYLPEGDTETDHEVERELADFVTRLISRQIGFGIADPLQFLSWLRIIPGRVKIQR